MAERRGLTMREWRTNPETGLLTSPNSSRCSPRTRLGDSAARLEHRRSGERCRTHHRLAHAVGARVIVDGVSFVPHTIPDVADSALTCTCSASTRPTRCTRASWSSATVCSTNSRIRVTSSMPDSRQAAEPCGPRPCPGRRRGRSLDYVTAFHQHHGGPKTDSLRVACEDPRRSGATGGRAPTPAPRPSPATTQLRLIGPDALGTRCRPPLPDGHVLFRRRWIRACSSTLVDRGCRRVPGTTTSGGSRRPRCRPRARRRPALVRALHLAGRCRPRRRRARTTSSPETGELALDWASHRRAGRLSWCVDPAESRRGVCRCSPQR